ncbi:hypothetical protein TNCT_514941 [Trichonephila clavata]|uniref:Uncharacterized protein n=1 Tax=Trichonephila clavata TaxID=2740835 RepID=A0A8X6J6C8_TRICU|nr:hypothetical protein TNCT_514941 [Trichonephila clavata]
MRLGQEFVLIQIYVQEFLKLVLQNTEVKKEDKHEDEQEEDGIHGQRKFVEPGNIIGLSRYTEFLEIYCGIIL